MIWGRIADILLTTLINPSNIRIVGQMLNLILWLIVGIIVGAIAKAIYPGPQGGGILGSLILGIIGSFIGGTIASLLSGGGFALASAGLSVPGIILAIIGALIAIFIWQQIAKR